MKILVIILFLVAFTSVASQAYIQWGALQAGPYKVGFKTYNCYDYGRHVQPTVDFEGKKNEGETVHQIAVYVWYPVAADNKQPRMPYEEYAFLTKQSNTFRPLTEKEKQEANELIKMIASGGASLEITDAGVKAIAGTATACIKNAKPAAGKFPVLICGLQGGPSFNNVLYEYLAAKGYVVVASAGSIRVGKMEAFNPQRALLEQLGDMEYVTAFAAKLPYADIDNTGVLGVNFEGMTALLYQMKNQYAKAIVSIDGWEGKAGPMHILTNSIYYDAGNITVPYFAVMQDEKEPQTYLALSQSVYDSLLYADRYYYVLNGMSHVYLIANLYIVPNLSPEKKQAYRFLYGSIGHFFDAYIKRKSESVGYLKKPVAEKNIPAQVIKLELKKNALPAAPGFDDIQKLLQSGQTSKAITLIKQTRQLNPAAKIAAGDMINNWGYDVLRNKKFKDAIALFILNTEFYPNNASWFDSMAEGYEAAGDKDNMKKASQRVLDLLGNQAPLSAGDISLKQAAEKRIKD